MRPTPAEVIDGVRRILKDVIEPELGSDYARSRLREIRAVLAQVDWNDATLTVRRERDRFVDALELARSWADADPQRASLVPPPLSAPMSGGSFAELSAARDEAAGRLASLLESLEDMPGDDADDTVAELRSAIEERLCR